MYVGYGFTVSDSDLLVLLRGGNIETVNMTKQDMLCRLLPDRVPCKSALLYKF